MERGVARGVREKVKRPHQGQAREVFTTLQPLTGKDLLISQPVQNLLEYANKWEPFFSKRNPTVTNDTPGLHVSPDTGAIALPRPFVSPSTSETTKNATWQSVQFYWDTYFINKGLLLSGDPNLVDIAKGHVENFEYLFDRLGYIPNASKISIANRTQIPFLAGMIIDVYKVTGDKEWLKEKMQVAKREYANWMLTDEEIKSLGLSQPSQRISKDSLLIRPVGRDIGKEHYPAAASTGEDDSAQWARRAYEYVPVTLNCALYKYESDFARAADVLGDPLEKAHWEGLAQKRKEEINKTFWNGKKGMYFDAAYNRKTGKWEQDSRYYGLTGFMPLWVGLSTSEQAEKMVRQLSKFETPYGLAIAAKDSLPSQGILRRQLRRALLGRKYQRYDAAIEDIFSRQQWDYPAIWAPMEYFTIDGLLRHRYTKEAQRIMENSLKGLAAFYSEKGTLPEKLNGITGMNGENFLYPDQEGFGWTNAYVSIVAHRLSLIQSLADHSENAYATIAA